jgi:hypothetical protein
MNPEPIKPLNVATYIVGSATAVAFSASAVPALAGNAHLTTTTGLIGLAVGASAGLVVGLIRRFK